jgi:RNA polymerase sigma-70 factor (ECF subfamily)
MSEIIQPEIQAGGSREDHVRLLVETASRGDEEAWNALHRMYRPLLSVVLRDGFSQALRTRFDTDDVLQSSFLAAFRSLPSFQFRNEESFRNWLRMIVVHKLRDRLRQHMSKRRNRMVESLEVDPNEMPDKSTLGQSPSQLISSAERHAQVLDAMTTLPEIDQEILTLRTLNRMGWGEICELLEIHDTTARRRHRDALERLIRRLN